VLDLPLHGVAYEKGPWWITVASLHGQQYFMCRTNFHEVRTTSQFITGRRLALPQASLRSAFPLERSPKCCKRSACDIVIATDSML
jgi:hypothetical protein